MVNRAGTEVERRFLVRARGWSSAAADASHERLTQAYLSTAPERIVRIRVGEQRAVLTVKGASRRGSRAEIECEIPGETARAIVDGRLFEGYPVEKIRSTLRVGDLVWEVDQFEGANAGLIIAEVELDDAVESREAWDARVDRERPPWLGREITSDTRFFNSSLAVRPFTTWSSHEHDEVVRAIES